MTTSGTYTYNPSLSDLVHECFSRISIRATEITADQIMSARTSLNLILKEWGNRGVNLWAVDLQTINLTQGITTYTLPTNTVQVLDAYIRQYSIGTPVDLAPAFSTTNLSTSVQVTMANSGAVVGNYINIPIPVAVGGLILQNYYTITSVIDNDDFTITAASAATSTEFGGQVPLFDTTSGSTTVTVTLANHGLLSGQTFTVQIATIVGGITISGEYTVGTVTDANTFTITDEFMAGATTSGYENGGDCQIGLQNTTQNFIDRIMAPISRTDYAALPNKFQQGFPTQFWFDRLITPTLTLWQVPDGNGPYQAQYYRLRSIQDAVPQNGQTVELPDRFFEALCCNLAWHLARKWNNALEAPRKQDFIEAWALAGAEDRERVSTYCSPDLSGYYSAQ